MDTYTIDTGNSNSNSSNTSTANLAQALKELVSTVSSRRGQGRDGGQSVITGSAKANSPLGAINSVCTIVRELPEEDLPHATNILFSLKKEVYQSHYYQQQHAHGTGRQVHTEGLLGFLDQSINLWNAGGTGTAAAAAATTSKAWAAEFSKAREEAVLLVREVVKHVGKSLEEYSECILDIRDTLFGMIKYDSSNSSALNVASIRGLYTLYKLRFSALTDEKSGNSSSTNGTAEELANYVLAKFNSSKSSQTVKGWALKLACLLCRLYSGTLLKGRGEHVLQTVLSTLDMQFRSPKPDMQVIDGALSGLCSLALIDRGALMRSAVAAGASTDDDDDDDDDKRVQLLYKYMCISLEPIKDLQRYDIPRTGLRVLRMHAGHLLRRHLTEDAERMFRRLCPLCTHVNNRLRHKALMGLDAFLGAVCQELLSGARAPASDKKTFLFLMNGLFRMLESPDSSSREIAMGIRGLGRLAAAMKLFFDDDFIRTRLDSLYLFAERLLPGGAQAEEDALLHTARFVGSYAAIAAQLGSVDETRIGQMERLVCALFQTYPDLHASQKPAHHLALLQMLCAVFGKGNALQSLLSRFVVQGLLMTCGESGVVRTIPLLDKIGSGGGSGAIPEQIPLYVEYVPLWQSLLEPSEHDRNFAGSLLLLTTTSGKAAGPNDNERKKAMDALCRTVYDVFVQGVLHTVQRLDLTYSVRKSTGNSAAQAATGGEEDAKLLVDEVVAAPGMYVPRSPKEMETFLKLVEFLKLLLLLPGTSADAFARWAFIFGREITSLSSRLPLISGFYRLLTVSMKLCEKTKYFSGLSRSPDTCAPSRYESFVSMECEEGEGGGGGVHTSDLEQRRLCKDLYTKFLREVAVRLQQYQDELLCACLELLLEAPCQLLAPCQVVGPLVQAFELGTSYLPIALTALRSLRRWLDYEGEEEVGNGNDSGGGEEAPRKEYESIREFLPNILPCLDDYLLIPARPNAEDQGDPSQQQQSAQSKQWAGAKQRQNKYMALAKDMGVALEDVQEAIVLLLGSLGSLSACMVGKVDLGDEKRLRGPAIAWDKERKIELKLGFGADRATMLLDSLLPRALVLAESSSNRQTKIAACELLHSLLLLMIGLEANSQAANMSRYYEKTLPAVLRLATDTEIVARQLFEPLVVQVIHWFTSPTEARKQKYSENAGYLLEALTENVCAKGQSALRDLCARCIGEYVAWAIKHTPPEQSRSPKSLAGVQVRMLLDRAFTLSRLYDPAKRLGAAITLQKMIVPLREDPGLASLFTLEIAHHALFSLRLARGNNSNGSDNDASTNEDEDGELLAAEMQMVSVVRSLCRVIKHYSQTFIETSKLRNVHQSLEELLCWVLESALTRHEALHHALCFEVLDALVPLLPSAKGSSSSGSGSGSGGGAVDNWPPFTDAVARGAFEDRNMIPKVAVEVSASPAWLGVFASMLDSFTWASTHGLRPSVPGKGVVSAEIDALVSSLSDVSGTSELSSGGGVSERLRSSRREAVRALFDYVAAYTKAGFSLDSVVSSASIPNFLYLFLRCVHSPSVVSCKTGSVAKSRALRSALLRCGRLLCNESGGYLRDALQTSLRHLLAEPGCDLLKVDFSFAEGGGFRLEFTQELCAGYSDLCDLGLFAPSESLAIGEHIQAGLFDNCTAYTATPAKAALAGVLFGLSLKLVGEEKRSTSFMQFLVSEDTERAQAFYAAFEGRIAAYVLSADNFARFCPAIMEGMARSEILWSLFAGVLSRRRSIQADGNSFRNAVIGSGELVRTVLRSAKVLKEWTSEAATVESKERATEVLELLARIDQQEFARSCRGCVAEVLGKLLESTSKALKIRALGLLRFVGLEGVSGLRDKVHAIVTYDFPMRSSDLRPGSTACNEYIAMLDEILGALGETGSPALLEELYPVIREKDHMHKKAIAATFRRIEERVPGEQQLELVKVALAGSTERGYPQDLKNALINEVAIPLLDQIPQEYLVRLLCERVGALVRTVAVGVEHGHPPSPQERQHALFDRINAFALLRAAYERLTPELIRTDLNSAYVASASRAQPPKGNELTQAVMRAAHTARSERVLVDDEWATGELVLKYHCFAYSTLAAVVICTQSKEAFYTTLFFKEHPEKDDLIWDNVVDLGKTFRFDVETNFPVATKAVRSLQPGGATTGLPGELARKKRRVDAIRYISSQYLQDSSFSQDLSYMGSFAPPVVAAAAAAAADNDNSSTSSSEAKDDESEENKKEVVMTTAVQRKERIVEVEMDEVNKSFLMAPFMRLLDAIALKFPLKAEGDVPDWEDEFLEKFKSSETHMNVRIFIAKCLVNRPQVFSVHSQYWIRPVLRFAVSLPQTQGISYFLRDICVLILRWLKDKDDVNIQLDFSSSVQDSNLVSQFIVKQH